MLRAWLSRAVLLTHRADPEPQEQRKMARLVRVLLGPLFRPAISSCKR